MAASTGSACHEDTIDPSPVLTAMGRDPVRAASAIRLSPGRTTPDTGLERAVQTSLAQPVTELAGSNERHKSRCFGMRFLLCHASTMRVTATAPTQRPSTCRLSGFSPRIAAAKATVTAGYRAASTAATVSCPTCAAKK